MVVTEWRQPELDKLYRNHLEYSPSERHTLPAVVQSIITDLRESSGSTRPIYAPRSLRLALGQEQLERGASVHGALRPFLPCLYRLAARGHWLAEQRPIRRKQRLWEAPEGVPIVVPNVTADDFVLSTVFKSI